MGPVTSTFLLGGFLIQDTPSVTIVQFAADAPRDPVDPAEQAALIPTDAPRDPYAAFIGHCLVTISVPRNEH